MDHAILIACRCASVRTSVFAASRQSPTYSIGTSLLVTTCSDSAERIDEPFWIKLGIEHGMVPGGVQDC